MPLPPTNPPPKPRRYYIRFLYYNNIRLQNSILNDTSLANIREANLNQKKNLKFYNINNNNLRKGTNAIIVVREK